MKKKVSIYELYDILEKLVQEYPEPMIENIFTTTKSPYFVVVATMLSARTKDTLTETKLPGLWKKLKAPEDALKISEEELIKLIYPIGFYKTKVQNIKKLSQMIIDDFDGVVPDTVEELVKLPGVGRKTANLVVSVAFNKPAICVDIHVHRIMNHIGYVNEKTPEKTEVALRAKLPVDLWQRTNYLLVQIGQYFSNHRTIEDPENVLNLYEVI